MIEKEQALLIKVLDLIAQRFDKRAVLRGGMVLRLLGCERLTNDLDYIFVPYKSKNDIVEEVIKTLQEIKGVKIEYSLNSKCLRVILTVDNISIQVEATVAAEVITEIVSNKEIAEKFGYPTRLIPVLDYSIALSNKMAAWNERRLIRDIYDIWFYLKMGVEPDQETLKNRLKKCSYSKMIKKDEYFQGKKINEFYNFLLNYVNKLTDKEIKNSLGDYLNSKSIPGLSMKFRAELAKLK